MAQISYGTITITDTTDIDRIENWYLATDLSSGVTRNNPSSGHGTWSTTIQSMDSTKQYLWNYEKIIGTGEVLINQTDPVIIGRYGQNGNNGADGNSITSIDEYYQATASTTNPGSSGWQKNTLVVPTSTNKYLWNYQVINYSKSAAEGSYTDARIIGVYGEKGDPGNPGTNGINTATVYLYQRKSTTPSKPTNTLTYTFSTQALSGTINNGWNTSLGSLTGTDPIWVIAAVPSSNTSTDTITSSEWSTPVKLAQNGTDGQPGGQGAAGFNQATVYIYKRGDSAGTISPATTTYTFSSGEFTEPNNWSKTIPSTPAGKPCWVSTAIAIGNEATATLRWNNPSILVEDGADGQSPTVTATASGVEIYDPISGQTYTITNGNDGQSYYTYIRYADDSSGTNMDSSPTGKTYIGVYTGTNSQAPSSASSYAPWMKFIGTDGSPGISVTNVRELYWLKTNSTTPSQITWNSSTSQPSQTIYSTDRQNSWTSVVPTYVTNGTYYTCVETSLSNSTKVWSIPVLDEALTTANYNAAMAESLAQSANENAHGAMSQATETQYQTEVLAARVKNYWWDSTGAHIASGIVSSGQTVPANVAIDDPSSYGFNSLVGLSSITFGYNTIKALELDGATPALKFYKPSKTTQGALTMELTSSELKFYGSSTSTADATLTSTGLNVVSGSIQLGDQNSLTPTTNKKGFYVNSVGAVYIGNNTNYIRFYPSSGTTPNQIQIQGGTVSNNGFIFLSTTDYGTALTIGNGTNKTDWRLIVGSKFGIDDEGNLYASSVDLTGIINANSGSIGGWTIGNTFLSTSSSGTPGSGVITLSKGIAGLTTATGVLPASQTWAFTASNQFGVTTAGKLYATGADITGSIVATSFTAKANNVDRVIVNSDGLTIKDASGNLKAVFGSSINIYGGNSSSGALPKVYIGSTNIQIQGANTNNKANYIQVNSTGLEIFKEASSVALFGATTRIGPEAANKNNIVIDGNSIKFRQNTYNLATFKTVTGSYTSDGLTILADGQFNVYTNGHTTSTYPEFQIDNTDNYFMAQFKGSFTPIPTIVAQSTSSNVSLNSGTITDIPLNQGWLGFHHEFFEVKNNRVYVKRLDGIAARVTASIYVVPTSGANINLFIYYHSVSNNTDEEIAASATYTTGGTIQVTPRIITGVYSGDYFYLKARVQGSNGTVTCNHHDTQLTVELI